MILRVLTTKHGWIDLKELKPDTEVYCVKFDGVNKILTTEITKDFKRISGELFCYFNDVFNGYAFKETKVFYGKKPINEITFDNLLDKFSNFNFTFSTRIDKFKIGGVQKTVEEINSFIKNRIFGGIVKKMTNFSSLNFIRIFDQNSGKIFVYSEKESSDLQTICLRAFGLTNMKKTETGKMFMARLSDNQVCSKLESMGNFEYNIPIDKNKNLLHLIVRDDEQRISIF